MGRKMSDDMGMGGVGHLPRNSELALVPQKAIGINDKWISTANTDCIRAKDY